MISILQVGLGPLGQKIGKYIADRNGVETIAAVDTNPDLIGKDFGALLGHSDTGILIEGSIAKAIQTVKPKVAILSTVSDLKRIVDQIEEIAKHGISIVSTCEELSYPWETDPLLASRIDQIAKIHGVDVVSTGVNPGFLMDALPSFLTAVCQEVSFIEVHRIQDAQYRRLPFQKKIIRDRTLAAFEQKKQDGTLRHVGLTESMQLIANRMGWKIDRTEDIIEPVIAKELVETKDLSVPKGDALGVLQTGKAFIGEELRILLIFKAAIGLPESFDLVKVKGLPDINSKVSGGINGDIATCAIVINTIPQILRVSAGLKTMADIPLVSYFS